MILAIDCHVHAYPDFDFAAAVHAALQRVRSFIPSPHECSLVLCLTERSDCDFFPVLMNAPGVKTVDSGLVSLDVDSCRVYVLQGYQSISSEGIELLCVGLERRFADGSDSLLNLVRAVRERGALPVLPWGLGKWRGSSVEVRERALASDADILLTTTALHHPALRRRFERRYGTRRFLYGSDPLPAAGEERTTGQLLSICDIAVWDERKATLLAALRHAPLRNVASRVSLPGIVRRELRRRFQLSWI